MTEITNFCEYFYHCSLIPIYIYKGSEIIECYPDQKSNIFILNSYREVLMQTLSPVTCLTTEQQSYFGHINHSETGYSIIIGPVTSIPYPEDSLRLMGKDYFINDKHFETFSEFIHHIPLMNMDTFLSTLLFLNYVLNKTQLKEEDIIFKKIASINLSIQQEFSSKNYDAKEDGILNNNYETETELLRYIETGNLDGLRQFTEHSKIVSIRPLASNGLRHLKNICHITITLASRAAMKGGLSPSIAYLLSNVYYNQTEHITNREDLMALIKLVQEDFCIRTAEVLSNFTTDSNLNKVINYVRANTNRNITVADVAGYIGFSYTYLSRKFKKELGVNLSDFIRRCKLEESRELLTYSDKNLSQISNYLCFSSQSHFQRAFKEEYGITPQKFRKLAAVSETKSTDKY